MNLFVPPGREHPVRQIFRSKPAPRPVVCDLVHFEAEEQHPEYWTLRLYRDDFDSFPVEDRLVIHNWVSDTIKAIRLIEPNCWVEVYERVPR